MHTRDLPRRLSRIANSVQKTLHVGNTETQRITTDRSKRIPNCRYTVASPPSATLNPVDFSRLRLNRRL